MKTVHEFFHEYSNDGAQFVHSWFYSLMVIHFAGEVARIEGLRGRMSEAGRQVEGLFQGLLSEAFEK
jgi:hypothetical protein